MGAYGLTIQEEREVARLYGLKKPNGQQKHTQAELAQQFHVAPITVRRALAEQGVIELVGYKTRKETSLLELLKENNITTLKDLRELLNGP